jgi:GntR family phosphonate transport system transcriptional regulator
VDENIKSAGKGLPIYRQLACTLEDMITKDFKVGDYLPSENELSLQFGVNRHTVRRAIDDLVTAGFILRQQGKGSLIINNQIEYPLSSGRFTASLDKLRRHSTSELLKSDRVTSTSKVADYLGISEGNEIIVIETLRFVDNQPISLITHFLNPEYVPDIDNLYLGGSLHQCIQDNYQIKLNRISALISAVMPDRGDAFQLKSSLSQPLLKIKSFNAIENEDEKIVEVSISRNRSDRFQIKIPSFS